MVGLKDDHRRLRVTCQHAVDHPLDLRGQICGLLSVAVDVSLAVSVPRAKELAVGQKVLLFMCADVLAIFAEDEWRMRRDDMGEREGGLARARDPRELFEHIKRPRA